MRAFPDVLIVIVTRLWCADAKSYLAPLPAPLSSPAHGVVEAERSGAKRRIGSGPVVTVKSMLNDEHFGA